jgi:hypothetical protein
VTHVEEREIEQAREAVQRSLDWQDHSAQESAQELARQKAGDDR